MAKLISEIDNHKNSIGRKKTLFGFGSNPIATAGKIGSALGQAKEAIPFLIGGAIILLAMILQ